jgi:hypothetical protein
LTLYRADVGLDTGGAWRASLIERENAGIALVDRWTRV